MSEIVTSFNDDRKYRHVTLLNGLDVMLVEDPKSEKCSACCNVKVGSMSDPKNAQGLAHFLEHMLFMGTETYPVENAYSSFLSSHGGSSNAYTGQENTVYYFDVQSDDFEEALNLFASFFTCPLFTASSTEREINAVDSESSKNLQADNWRQYQLLKTMAKEDHPFSFYSTGNKETLLEGPQKNGLNIRDMMIDFYNAHYSANIMKLAIYGNKSLDVLEAWVTEKFSAIHNKNVVPVSISRDVFKSESLCTQVQFVPVKDEKNLVLHFPIPPVHQHYASAPHRYISHCIGHESEGSILSYFKSLHWANGLGAYVGHSLDDFAIYTVSVEVTDAGMKHVDEIIQTIFQYIGMLLREGPKLWILEEMKLTDSLNFRYLSKVTPSRYVIELTENMQLYPVQHIVSGGRLIYDCNVDQINPILKQLTVENCFVFIQNRDYLSDIANSSNCPDDENRWKVEAVYGTQYQILNFTAQQVHLWKRALSSSAHINVNENLHLPSENPFIPTDFELRCNSSLYNNNNHTIDESADYTNGDNNNNNNDSNSNNSNNSSSSNNNSESEEVAVRAIGGGVLQLINKQNCKQNNALFYDTSNGTSTATTNSTTAVNTLSLLTWHKCDVHWKLPKAIVTVIIESLEA